MSSQEINDYVKAERQTDIVASSSDYHLGKSLLVEENERRGIGCKIWVLVGGEEVALGEVEERRLC